MRWRWPVAAAVGAGVAAAAGGAVALATANRRWRADPAVLEAAGRTLPADVVDHFVAVDDGGQIHAVERGQGPPIVLVHGVTLGVAIWAPQLRALADDGHRVIAIGQRGHGRSLAGEGGYSLERLADDLAEVLEALDVTGAVLVGHSMGGMVAQLLALRHGERPGPPGGRAGAGGHLVGPAHARADRPAGPAPHRWGRPRPAARPSGAGAASSPTTTWGPWPPGSASAPTRPRPTSSSPGRRWPPCHRPPSRASCPASSPSTCAPGSGPSTLPTWVVVGSRDVLTPPRMARATAAAIPGAAPRRL